MHSTESVQDDLLTEWRELAELVRQSALSDELAHPLVAVGLVGAPLFQTLPKQVVRSLQSERQCRKPVVHFAKHQLFELGIVSLLLLDFERGPLLLLVLLEAGFDHLNAAFE